MTEKRFEITMNTLASCLDKIIPLLKDENIFEVYVNPDGKIWTDGYRGRENTGIKITAAQVKQIILNVAALTNQLVTEEKPALDAEIPANNFFDKCRFEGNLPMIVPAPSINIRKHPKKIFTLEDYENQGILSKIQHSIILEAIQAREC